MAQILAYVCAAPLLQTNDVWTSYNVCSWFLQDKFLKALSSSCLLYSTRNIWRSSYLQQLMTFKVQRSVVRSILELFFVNWHNSLFSFCHFVWCFL